ncbi:hypothetical protein ABS71_10540 [bacterium SCN 62-11]|nr:thioester reductase domain-containing protein [Candidatus Eremiobacteraeota bacterium]ODT67619.1 MAG: hypothetical protein ABS71_10540 [bacterium SCN 62-11]
MSLAAEVQLPADLVDPREQPRAAAPERALLTGATGFLGAYVLDEVLRRTSAEVVCLVRAADASEGLERIRANLAHYELEVPWERVRVLAGSLEEPQLGLEESAYRRLAEETDCLYHVAANVNFLPTYEKLKSANVGGLLAMLRLAACGVAKPIHHVSTYSVFNAADYHGCGLAGEQPLEGEGEGFRRGYPASKWVAERVGDLARARGWSIASYRAGLLTGDQRHGRGKDDMLSLNLAACRELGVAQDLDFLLHFTPVDYAAAALVEISRGAAQGHYHLVTERPIGWRPLLDWLESRGERIRRVNPLEWYDLFKSRARGRADWMALLFLLSQDPTRTFWNDANVYSMQFEATRVRAALAGTGVECPPLEDALLELYFKPG